MIDADTIKQLREANAALIAERANLIETKREQIALLTKENEELRALVGVLQERIFQLHEKIEEIEREEEE